MSPRIFFLATFILGGALPATLYALAPQTSPSAQRPTTVLSSRACPAPLGTTRTSRPKRSFGSTRPKRGLSSCRGLTPAVPWSMVAANTRLETRRVWRNLKLAPTGNILLERVG